MVSFLEQVNLPLHNADRRLGSVRNQIRSIGECQIFSSRGAYYVLQDTWPRLLI